jgi:hypothetical protein
MKAPGRLVGKSNKSRDLWNRPCGFGMISGERSRWLLDEDHDLSRASDGTTESFVIARFCGLLGKGVFRIALENSPCRRHKASVSTDMIG